MRSLLRFIIRYHFAILFVLLEIVSVVLILNFNPIQRGYASRRFNSISSQLYNLNYKVARYMHLAETNETLARENATIRGERLAASEDSVHLKGTFRYTPAQVINNSVHLNNNYLTLDVGSNDGIEPDMGVVSSFGVVGIVKAVSPNFCRVISVLNRQLRISVKLMQSEYFGSLNWTGPNYQKVLITEIPSHAQVQEGDTLVTSGYSAIFPPGEKVAIIETSQVASSGNFLEIEAQLSNDFKKLSRVYVVKNEKRDEIKQLEEEL